MAENHEYGGEENEEKAYYLGSSKPGQHEAIRPEALNPKATDGIEHEVGKKYIALDYGSSPSEP